MGISTLTFLRLACFVALSSSAWAKKSTVTKTVTVTKTKGHGKTKTLTTIASDTSIIDGDLYGFGISTYTVAVYETVTIDSSVSVITVTPTTTVYATPLTTKTEPYGSYLPIRSTLPDSAYHYQLDTVPDPVGKRDLGDAAVPEHPRLVARKKSTKVVTSTKTKTKTVKAKSSATVTTTLTGTVITWADEGVTTEYDEWATNVVYVTVTSTVTSASTTHYPLTFGTSTRTETISTTTVYQACSTENFADAIEQDDGSYVAITGLKLQYPYGPSGAESAYECCDNAWRNTNSGVVFLWNTTGCFYSFDQQLCGEINNIIDITAYTGTASSPPAIVGNLRCGYITSSTPQP